MTNSLKTEVETKVVGHMQSGITEPSGYESREDFDQSVTETNKEKEQMDRQAKASESMAELTGHNEKYPTDEKKVRMLTAALTEIVQITCDYDEEGEPDPQLKADVDFLAGKLLYIARGFEYGKTKRSKALAWAWKRAENSFNGGEIEGVELDNALYELQDCQYQKENLVNNFLPAAEAAYEELTGNKPVQKQTATTTGKTTMNSLEGNRIFESLGLGNRK
jgi:hypothetical protein